LTTKTVNVEEIISWNQTKSYEKAKLWNMYIHVHVYIFRITISILLVETTFGNWSYSQRDAIQIDVGIYINIIMILLILTCFYNLQTADRVESIQYFWIDSS